MGEIMRPNIDGTTVRITATLGPWLHKYDGAMCIAAIRQWSWSLPKAPVLAAHILKTGHDRYHWQAWPAFGDGEGSGPAKSLDEAKLLADAWIAARCGATPPPEEKGRDEQTVAGRIEAMLASARSAIETGDRGTILDEFDAMRAGLETLVAEMNGGV